MYYYRYTYCRNNFVTHYIDVHIFAIIFLSFTDCLGELFIDQEINIGRLTEGRNVKRVRVRHNVSRNKRIAEAQASLSLGR